LKLKPKEEEKKEEQVDVNKVLEDHAAVMKKEKLEFV